MKQDPEGEEGNGCLKYIVEVKTKSPIDERKKTVVVRNINLNIWKALDEHLPKDICCSVYSQDPEHDNQMHEEGAKAERERVLNIILEWGVPISPNDIRALLNAPTRTPSEEYCEVCVDGIAAPCKLPEPDCKRFGISIEQHDHK